MRISDWSSDVCSSDLRKARVVEEVATFHEHREAPEQRLVGRRDVDVLAVARLVEVVRRMARQPRARALGHGAAPFVGRPTGLGQAERPLVTGRAHPLSLSPPPALAPPPPPPHPPPPTPT